jgi:hypothetical protein
MRSVGHFFDHFISLIYTKDSIAVDCDWSTHKAREGFLSRIMEDELFGEQLLDELEGGKVAERGLQRMGGPEGDSSTGPVGVFDWVEEYAVLVIVLAVVLYFVYKLAKKWYEDMAFAAAARQAEDNMRRARLLQQAKFEVETAKRKEELAQIEEQKRQQKLEEMVAMQEGRSAKKPEQKKKTDTRDYWDNAGGFNHMGGGGGSGPRYKPTTTRKSG